MSTHINRGDYVRRKSDPSGRIRRVGTITTDADGERHVILNGFIDGWLIWNANELIAVPLAEVRNGSHKRRVQPARQNAPHRRATQ